MVVRFYSSVAPETTLSAGVTNASTSIQVGSTTGFPANTPYTIALDYEGAIEELVQVNAAAGTTLTVDRAVDGTSAAAHNAGARVRHVSSARDFSDSRTHENSANGIHGLAAGDTLVGTNASQTLSNKTLNLATGTLQNININNVGTFLPTITGDPAFPNAFALQVRPDASTNATARIANSGAFYSINTIAADTSNSIYRFRATKFNTTTDIFSVLSGGQVVAWLNNGTDGYTLNASPDNVRRLAYKINASDGSTFRGGLYTDGTGRLNNTTGSFANLALRPAVGQVPSALSVETSGGTDNAGITSTGQVYASSAGFITTGPAQVGSASSVSTGINYQTSQTGTVNMTWSAGTAGQWVQVPVTFPQPFASTPVVQITPQNNAPAIGGNTLMMFQVTGVTNSGFTACGLRGTAFTNQPFGWTATGA